MTMTITYQLASQDDFVHNRGVWMTFVDSYGFCPERHYVLEIPVYSSDHDFFDGMTEAEWRTGIPPPPTDFQTYNMSDSLYYEHHVEAQQARSKLPSQGQICDACIIYALMCIIIIGVLGPLCCFSLWCFITGPLAMLLRYKALKRVDEKLVNIPPIMRMTDEDASRNVPQLYKLRDYLDLRRVPGMICFWSIYETIVALLRLPQLEGRFRFGHCVEWLKLDVTQENVLMNDVLITQDERGEVLVSDPYLTRRKYRKILRFLFLFGVFIHYYNIHAMLISQILAYIPSLCLTLTSAILTYKATVHAWTLSDARETLAPYYSKAGLWEGITTFCDGLYDRAQTFYCIIANNM